MSNEHTLALTPNERSQFEHLQTEFGRIAERMQGITSMASNTIAELWQTLNVFDNRLRALVGMIQSTRENILELLDAHTIQVMGTADAIIQACNVDDSPAPTTSALLDQLSAKYKEVFMRRVRQVPVRFFTPMPVEKGEASEDSVPRNTEIRNGHKLDTLLQILAKHNVGSNTIHILEETLEENQMRALPYYTVYLEDPMCTICISDQIGERTYVYPGVLVSAMQLASIQKQERIEETSPIGVTLGTWYAARLEAAIFTSDRTSTVFRDTEADAPTTLAPEQRALLDNAVVDPVVMQEEGLERVLQMQMDILGIQKELEAVGVIFWNGRVCTGEMKSEKKWPDINGKNLSYYPNGPFLVRHKIIAENCRCMKKPKEFWKLLQALGFSLISDADTDTYLRQYDRVVRCPIYKAAIESIKADLEKAGAIFWNGQVCTKEMKECKKWPEIHGGNLCSFPGREFLHRFSIIKADETYMHSSIEFAKFLTVIGFTVVREADEEAYLRQYDSEVRCPIYKAEIDSIRGKLEDIGVSFRDQAVCTNNMQRHDVWPDINGKNLRCYPNLMFLRRYGIIVGAKERMKNKNKFTTLLRVLGFTVVDSIPQE